MAAELLVWLHYENDEVESTFLPKSNISQLRQRILQQSLFRFPQNTVQTDIKVAFNEKGEIRSVSAAEAACVHPLSGTHAHTHTPELSARETLSAAGVKDGDTLVLTLKGTALYVCM